MPVMQQLRSTGSVSTVSTVMGRLHLAPHTRVCEWCANVRLSVHASVGRVRMLFPERPCVCCDLAVTVRSLSVSPVYLPAPACSSPVAPVSFS